MRIKEGNASLLTEIYQAALPAATPYVSVFLEENPSSVINGKQNTNPDPNFLSEIFPVNSEVLMGSRGQ